MRSNLIQTSIDLFCEQGLHQTSMQNIATACGLKKASIYHYVSTRDALLMMVLDHVAEHFEDTLFSLADADDFLDKKTFSDFLKTLFHVIHKDKCCLMLLSFYEHTPRMSRELSKKVKHLFNTWVDLLEKAVIQKKKRSTKATRLLAEDLMAQVQGAIVLQRFGKNPQAIARVIKQIASVHGISVNLKA